VHVGRRLFFSVSFRLAVHYVRTRLLFLVDNMHEHSFTFLICLQQTADKKKLLRVFHANRHVYYFTIPICRLSHERQFLNLNLLLHVTAYRLVYRYRNFAGHLIPSFGHINGTKIHLRKNKMSHGFSVAHQPLLPKKQHTLIVISTRDNEQSPNSEIFGSIKSAKPIRSSTSAS
jgi:hypothetical protein